MNLTEILVTPDEAKAKLDEYRSLAYQDRTLEDERIAAGYRAAARGLQVIRLPQTVVAGGWHEGGFPRIAVVRATAQSCWVHWDGHDLVFADTDNWLNRVNRSALVNEHSVRITVPGDNMPPAPNNSQNTGATVRFGAG